MRRVGIFARTYSGLTLPVLLDKIVAEGIGAVHFNLKCAGFDALPDALDEASCRAIYKAFTSRDLDMIGVSGTFNAIDPDVIERAKNISRCITLIKHASLMGTTLVSLCTGTRTVDDMWQAHPGNNTPEAWSDLLSTLEQLLPVAQQHKVVLGIEPEHANVINTASKARQLLDEVRSDYLKIILDGANLFSLGSFPKPPEMQTRLGEAFDLLGDDLVQMHAKDIPAESVGSQAAGTGLLDWETYFDLIARSGYGGPVVMHNLQPAQISVSREFVQSHLNRIADAQVS